MQHDNQVKPEVRTERDSAGSRAATCSAQEMDAEMLRCLLWLMLHHHGGSVTFTRNELNRIPLKGELFLTDGRDEMTLKAIVPNK